MQQAAGILFLAKGHALLVRRADGSDHAGEWAFPGGGIEEGETPEQAALRECVEEIGSAPDDPGVLFARRNDGNVDFFTFLKQIDTPFKPTLNDEHDGFQWCVIGDWPKNVHPGAQVVLDKLTMNELDIARAMVKGDLTSPQFYMNLALFDIRITGTGTAYRENLNEFVFRDPKYYLTDDFLARCNGLPVILEHPDNATLDSQEFSDRIIGTVLVPYLKDNEVWAIVKIYDTAAAEIMETEKLSTSPSVAFRDHTKNRTVMLADGNKLLIEGDPSLLDHIAICPNGVWDKAGEPTGVISTTADDKQTAPRQEPNTEKVITMPDDNEDPAMADAKKDAAGGVAPSDKIGEPKSDAKADGVDGTGAGDVSLSEIKNMLASLISSQGEVNSRMDSIESKFKNDATDGSNPRETPAGVQPVAPESTDKEKLTDMPEPKEGSPSSEAAVGATKEDSAMPEDYAALKARMDAFDKKMDAMPKEPTQEEQSKFMDAQAKADSVAQAFGDSAPRPIAGESLVGYRKRLLKAYQPHSPAWSKVNLATMTADVLDVAEPMIYNDAQKAAKNPTDVAEDTLREVISTDRTGRRISEFRGKPRAWMGGFRATTRRVSAFGTNQQGA